MGQTSVATTTAAQPAAILTASLAAALDKFSGQVVADIAAIIAGTAQSADYKCRNVVTSLAAYAGSGTGTLTASSNGAWAAQDGVTNAASDVVFSQGGTTNLTDPKDSGPWVISSLGGASAKWVLVRPAWWATGAAIVQGQVVHMGGEGTFWAGTEWKAFCAGSKVVDTDDPTFYVGRVSQAITLTSSTVTLSNVGIRSASKSNIIPEFQTAGGTVTGTVGYGLIAAPTPGYIGTASAVVDALASGMTKNGTADASTLIVTVVNW